jgi:outer membrane scaffolding protein for murein synthesis (MipA/OmpV family)
VAAQKAEPDGKPLFELGLVGGGGYTPDYPAAGQNHFQGLALPYVAYRGEFLRAGDRGFVRGRLVRRRNLELDVSLGGSFPADSDANDARRGMPDLDWLGEVGPRLQYTVARAARDARIDLELPIRAAFSTNFTSELEFRGFVFAPELAYQNENFLDADLELKLGVGPSFASEDLMDYFYEVSPAFATPARPAFDAGGGYLGTKLELLLTKQVNPRIRSFFALRADLHHGASNRASPLFRQDLTFSVGIGLVVSLYQSERRVRE